jgi:hypothetical protein
VNQSSQIVKFYSEYRSILFCLKNKQQSSDSSCYLEAAKIYFSMMNVTAQKCEDAKQETFQHSSHIVTPVKGCRWKSVGKFALPSAA